ncbi:metalloregulator ArsR/SmtB family transcription factor [uncultured Methylovirgula sp.]|uniref:ArsR/SmtB family transcription factor n=1 Tax=uncultured Methylovirgula sp. TaxID=1285960 RepID=UPI00260E52BB|nr:metalloregulator ArsR/SmtB family transcription factor [uncultured Methylovirgula sp.]
MDREETILALAALAQPTRLDAFRLLVKHEPDGLPQGELAEQLGVPQNTLSSHLNILTRAGLVRSARHSRSVIYRADLARLRDVTLYLVKDCCGGRAELCEPLVAELKAPCCPPQRASRRKKAHV